MAGLFRTRQPFLQNNSWQNQALNALHYNTSQQGSVLPLIYGTTRQQVNLINFANYIGPNGKKGKSGSIPITGTSNTGKGGGASKGKGSKKSGGDYSIDVDFAICQGPVGNNSGNNLVFSSTGVEPFASSGLNFYDGSDGQAPDSTFLSFGFPVGYSGSCHITGTPMDLGQSPVIPNLSFEITGFETGTNTGGYTTDANPGNIITDFLTNLRYGVGFSITNLDDLIAGSGLTYGDYCQAAQLLVSISLDGHQTALEWIDPLAKMTNTAMIFSDGLLKFIPYGDLALNSNGATWTPNLVPVYSLTDEHFLPWHPHKDGGELRPGEDDPILLTVTNAADVANWLSIEYTDRTNYYNSTIITVYDQSLVDEFGLRIGDSLQGRMFCNPTSAQISAQLYLQRSIYFRDKPYKFNAGWQFALLEPMDIVLLTGRFGDNYLNETPVRILSIEENDNGDLTFEAEEVQVGQNAPPPAPVPASIELVAAAFSPSGDTDPPLGPTGLVTTFSTLGGGSTGITTTVPTVVVVFVTSLQDFAIAGVAGGVPPYAASVKSPNLGNFSRRSRQTFTPISSICGSFPPCAPAMEMWWAFAPSPLNNEVVELTYYPPGCACGLMCVTAWSGVSQSSPWDSNPGLPAVEFDVTNVPTAPTISGVDTNAPGAVLSFTSSWVPPFIATPAGGWTAITVGSYGQFGVDAFIGLQTQSGCNYQLISSPASGLTVEGCTDLLVNWMMVADCLVM